MMIGWMKKKMYFSLMDYKGCKIVPHWYTTGYYEWYHEDTLDYDRGHGICTSIEEAMQEVDEYVDSELKEK